MMRSAAYDESADAYLAMLGDGDSPGTDSILGRVTSRLLDIIGDQLHAENGSQPGPEGGSD